jgi:hypothetical protein
MPAKVKMSRARPNYLLVKCTAEIFFEKVVLRK